MAGQKGADYNAGDRSDSSYQTKKESVKNKAGNEN